MIIRQPDQEAHRSQPGFSPRDRDAIYHVIRARRDIRHFTSKPIPTSVLERILQAAHQAPSVGFMQPWNFILITSQSIRQRVRESFDKTNAQELAKLTQDERQTLYRTLKLEGILEAPLNIAVTCDRRRDLPFVLGRAPMPETDLFSTCLAIENLWLAARAEGVGVGWVSILEVATVEQLLQLPDGVRLVAYLCVGYPVDFPPRPLLEDIGWKSRLPLASLIYENGWAQPCASLTDAWPPYVE
jgi:5,6-dimethylbenzimidazole synthase